MFDIIMLPSGFYAMQATSDGNITHPDLIRWDGKRGTDYPYDVDNDRGWEYYINAEGTVYYCEEGGKNARVWCAASRLRKHTRYLHSILKH